MTVEDTILQSKMIAQNLPSDIAFAVVFSVIICLVIFIVYVYSNQNSSPGAAL